MQMTVLLFLVCFVSKLTIIIIIKKNKKNTVLTSDGSFHKDCRLQLCFENFETGRDAAHWLLKRMQSSDTCLGLSATVHNGPI